MASHVEPRCTVAVFARTPVPGATKTRLIPSLGAEGASELHRWLIDNALATATAAAVGPVELWCTPTTGHLFFSECVQRHDVTLRLQAQGDIGARMHAAAEDILKRSATMVLIGTDCPAMTAEDIQRSAAALVRSHDAVFLPVEDGGYTLVGLARPQPALFRDIDWSTERVMPQSRERLRGLGLRWLELDIRWDLDRPEDLGRLQRE